jgi:hypothetical protein
MKLSIVNRQSNEPVLVLDQDEYGMKVVGGDAKMVDALKLGQFRDLKEIADYINSANSDLVAIGDESQSQAQGQEPDGRSQAALQIIKDLMSKVNDRMARKEAEKNAKTPEARASATMGAQVVYQPGEQVYVSLDGDNIGNAVARAEEVDDEKTLQEMSAKINAGQDIFRQWAQQNGGQIIEAGGDEGLAKVPSQAVERIEDLRNQYLAIVGATCSVGVGKKISESTKARMLAKLKGKNRTEIYTEDTPKELQLRMDAEDSEAKKIRSAMNEPGAPQPVGAASEAVQSEQPVREGAASDGREAQRNPPQEDAPIGEGKTRQATAEDEGFVSLSPELLKGAQEHFRSEKKTDSVMASSLHDHDIESDNYEYSEDPEFSKALRYVVKHGE